MANSGALSVYAGYPQNSGITIPPIFSKRFRWNLYDRLVVANITNTDFEGELKRGAGGAGDTITVRTTSPITTFQNYQKGQPLPVQFLTPGSFDMPVNKSTGFLFAVDRVDEIQSDLELINSHADEASKECKVDIDTEVLGNIYSQAHASNSGTTAGAITSGYNLGVAGTPFGVTKANAIDKLVDMVSVLQENKVSVDEGEDSPWAVIPVWFSNLLQKSDIKDASVTGDRISVMRSGRLGKIAGIELYVSNLLHKATSGGQLAFDIIAGVRKGVAFYTQLQEDPVIADLGLFGFGKFCKGLTVYGYKVVHSACVAHLHAYKAE